MRAVIFDCDGTIYDNRGSGEVGDLNGLRRAFSELGIRADLPSKESLMSRMGFPYRDFFRGIIPDEHFERAYPLVHEYSLQECVRLVRQKKGRLYPESLKVLGELKRNGLALGLVTNGRKDYIDAVVETYALGRFMAVWMSVEEVRGDKGDLLLSALGRLGVSASDAVMVGDRNSDIAAARKAGCVAVAVTRGYGTREELAGADFIVNNLKEVLRVAR